MKTFRFDAFEFEPRDSEQEVEVTISTSADARHSTMAKFADDVCGDGAGRRMGAPTAFSSSASFESDRANLLLVSGVDVPEACAWPCYIVSDDWNWRHILLDTGDAFISYRWSTSA